MRLEAVRAVGCAAFILVARGERDAAAAENSRVLRGASAEDILGALTGVAIRPCRPPGILTGCVVPWPQPWTRGGHATVGVDRSHGRSDALPNGRRGMALRAAKRRAGRSNIRVERQLPADGTLTSTQPDVTVDLTAALSQIETNSDLEERRLQRQRAAGRGTGHARRVRDSGRWAQRIDECTRMTN
jgi:hypothetical protein